MPLVLLASALAGVNWPCGRLHVAWVCPSSSPVLPQAGIRCNWRSPGRASGLSVAMWHTSSLDCPIVITRPGALGKCNRKNCWQECCLNQQRGPRVSSSSGRCEQRFRPFRLRTHARNTPCCHVSASAQTPRWDLSRPSASTHGK
jgi:hypothetical protein